MKRKISLLLAILMVFGLFATGAMAAPVEPASTFTTIPMIAAGWDTTTALASNGTVWTWGWAGGEAFAPRQVANLTNVVEIGRGTALREDGTVWYWGVWGDTAFISTQVPGLANVTAIAGNWAIVDGNVWTWEQESFWDGPNEIFTGSYIVEQVPGISGVTALWSGMSSSCLHGWVALREDGTVWFLERDWETGITTVRQVPGLTNVIAASNRMALRSDGTVWHWDYNWRDPDAGLGFIQPAQITGIGSVRAIAGAGFGGLILTEDGSVWDWGYVSWDDASATTTRVQGLNDIIAITSGVDNFAAVRGDGSVWTWRDYGATTPVRVPGPGGVGHFNLITDRHPFIDVGDTWYSNPVQFVWENDIMTGTGPTTFAPFVNVSRAMAVAALFRAHHGRQANASDSQTNPFTDVAPGAWYAPYITWAYNNNVVDGVGGNRFAPGVNVTREQLAAMFFRYADRMTDMDTTVRQGPHWNNFTDRGQISSWAQGPLMWANYHELVGGRTDTTIVPGGTAIRAEAATIMMRFMNLDIPAPEGLNMAPLLGRNFEEVRHYFGEGGKNHANVEWEFPSGLIVFTDPETLTIMGFAVDFDTANPTDFRLNNIDGRTTLAGAIAQLGAYEDMFNWPNSQGSAYFFTFEDAYQLVLAFYNDGRMSAMRLDAHWEE